MEGGKWVYGDCQKDRKHPHTSLSFQLTTATNSIGISIEQQFEHDLGVILRTANLVRFYLNAQFSKLQRIDKYIISSENELNCL